MKRFLTFSFFCVLSVILISVDVYAQIPRLISYQGVLTDSLGNPKSDGSYSLTFRLYDAESGGSSLWFETKTLLTKRGLFSTILGDQVPIGESIKFDKPYWLGIQVASNPELSPRVFLGSVGYSLNSAKADTASFAKAAPVQIFVDSARISGTVPKNSITSSEIMDGTIKREDVEPGFKAPIADTAIYALSAPIQSFVDSARIAGTVPDNIITSSKILNGTIKREDVEPGFIAPAADTALYALSAPAQAFVDSARVAGTAMVSVTSLSDTLWSPLSGNVIRKYGNVGIGTMSPLHRLHISDSLSLGLGEAGAIGGSLTLYPPDVSGWYHIDNPGGQRMRFSGGDKPGVFDYMSLAHPGYLGIGTITPDAPLTIQTRVGSELHFVSSGTNADINADWQLNINANTLDFLTGGIYRMNISSSGKVGIGNLSPQHLLDVNGNIKAADTVIATSFALSSPETAYVSGSAMALGRVLYPPDSLSYSIGIYNMSLGTVFYIVPLTLPQGVHLISVDLYGYDGSASEELAYSVLAQVLDAGWASTYASASSGVAFASGSFVATATLGTPLLIDNISTAYMIQVVFPPTTNIKYFSFRASYTFDKPGAITSTTNQALPVSKITNTQISGGQLNGMAKP